MISHCAGPDTALRTAVAPVAQPDPIWADWDHHPQGQIWTSLTHDALMADSTALLSTIPGDIETFCPNYEKLDTENRVRFWIALISSLARLESGHDPDTSYVESFKDQHGNFVVSRGLLQISIESGRGYNCEIPDAQSLHQAEVNLTCGVKIMNRWVGERDLVLRARENGKWRGAARYWSPFRSATKTQIIADKTRALSFCQHI